MIIFTNNTDFAKGLRFDSKRSFLAFANRYLADPKTWGDKYAQDIDGIDISWSPSARRGKGGWVENKNPRPRFSVDTQSRYR